ncbi:MFS transporter [Allokutzneria sp. A3M-2-11 16]|uniref:MFS transporter n=1 Tax=Allokutzneria sp. A3M-2-11 16 TaxID=2962043 RepID=UPI0020B88D26|nr:MFS transporter [Allokutzneria sp. A3M-2-11 16]MCP3804637.1 MFS transporter [Allokutzneria sp. A3M-2-11 16]
MTNRDFTALWVGQALSQLGTSVSAFAYPVIVLGLTGSAVAAGSVAAVSAATAFALRLPAGAWVDRCDRRRVMVLSDAVRALALTSLLIVDMADALTLPHILACAAVESAFGVLFGPAEAAALHRIVPADEVRLAVARNQARSHLAGLLGPSLGAVLISAGRGLPFAADAISYALSLVCVLSLRTPLPAPRRRRARGGGLHWLWRDRFLRFAVPWCGAACAVFSSIGIVVLVLVQQGGATTVQTGATFSITAAGGVLGAVLAPWLQRRLAPARTLVVFGWVAATVTPLLLVTDSPYLIGGIGALAFLMAPAVNAVIFGHITATAPDELQGRAHAAAMQVIMFLTPVSPLLAGLLLDSVGPGATVCAYAAILLLLAVTATSVLERTRDRGTSTRDRTRPRQDRGLGPGAGAGGAGARPGPLR